MLYLLQIDKSDQAIEDCTKAIELDDTYLKAYMRRAKRY
jgi:DnaJ family protein C protein 7